MPRVWFVKHGESPKFINVNNIPHFDEYLVISPEHILFYNLDKKVPNSYLQQFGFVMSNIPGDAMVVYETDDKLKDIDLNFEAVLKEMLKKDNQKRIEYRTQLEESGAQIVYF